EPSRPSAHWRLLPFPPNRAKRALLTPDKKPIYRMSLSDTAGSAASDARAADDCLVAVVEAHPPLAVAVVVGRPADERRVATSDAHALAAFFLRSAPDADERILPALAADRRLFGVAREDAHGVGQLEENLHHRASHSLHVAASDGVAEERVSGRDQLVADDEREAVVGVTGRRECLHAQLVPLPFARFREHRNRVPLRELVL